MFLNIVAIETLVNSDTSATPDEKMAVISALRGELPKPAKQEEDSVVRSVVRIKKAAQMLGYKGPRGVYRALHDGRLVGFYGGKHQRRCTGITMESIQRALLGKKKDVA